MEYFNTIRVLFHKYWKKEAKILFAALCMGICLTASIQCMKDYAQAVQADIAESVLRFHVLANSDTEADQALKLKVKEAVLESLSPDLREMDGVEDAAEYLETMREQIRRTAQRVIAAEGYDYPVAVTLQRDLFPVKTYGDVVFPAGMYDALRIEIGAGEGKNWWCVMYPPLCFVDVACETVDDETKEALGRVLSDEAYSIVVTSRTGEEVLPEIKFKVVEWWQEYLAGDDAQYATNPDENI